jgi:hypothetical protein
MSSFNGFYTFPDEYFASNFFSNATIDAEPVLEAKYIALWLSLSLAERILFTPFFILSCSSVIICFKVSGLIKS